MNLFKVVSTDDAIIPVVESMLFAKITQKYKSMLFLYGQAQLLENEIF